MGRDCVSISRHGRKEAAGEDRYRMGPRYLYGVLRFIMSQPIVVSIPHRLGREEAARRLKSGLANVGSNFGQLFAVQEQTWNGDHLDFRVSALGQFASGVIDVADDHVRLELTLPWLLAKLAETIAPAIRRQGTLMLEKK